MDRVGVGPTLLHMTQESLACNTLYLFTLTRTSNVVRQIVPVVLPHRGLHVD